MTFDIKKFKQDQRSKRRIAYIWKSFEERVKWGNGGKPLAVIDRNKGESVDAFESRVTTHPAYRPDRYTVYYT